MSFFSPLLLVLLLNVTGPVRPPVLSVKILHATKVAVSSQQAQRFNSAEMKSLFSKHNYRHFYLLGKTSLDFASTVSTPDKAVELPNKQSAKFRYRGFLNGQYVYDFSLPDYGVTAQIKATPGRTFYQAGIRYKGGMIILQLRAE